MQKQWCQKSYTVCISEMTSDFGSVSKNELYHKKAKEGETFRKIVLQQSKWPEIYRIRHENNKFNIHLALYAKTLKNSWPSQRAIKTRRNTFISSGLVQ